MAAEEDDVGVVLSEFLTQERVVVVEYGDGSSSRVEAALEIGALATLVGEPAPQLLDLMVAAGLFGVL